MAAGACFIGYRLSADRHAEIQRKLEERDALIDPAAGLEAMTGEDLAPANRPS